MWKFRFKNSFHVPETITSRGEVFRERSSSFELARINAVDHKFHIKREDTFVVNSGKIFSQSDYERYTELFNSEDVELEFMGQWVKVIVEEEEFSEPLRKNNLPQRSFKFRFADPRENNQLLAEDFAQWILLDGTWIDENVWIDSAPWNDGD